MLPSRIQLARCLRYRAFRRSRWRLAQHQFGIIRWQTTAYTESSASTLPPKPKQSNAWLYFSGVSFVLVGAGLGYLITTSLRPPKAPSAGSAEDQRLLAILSHDVDSLHIVRTMRRNSRQLDVGDEMESARKDTASVTTPLERLHQRADEQQRDGEKINWIELPMLPPEKDSLTALMTGFGGTGVQRAFWNPASQELVMIVWFGSSLCGWPGLAHGGAIATVLVEGTRRVAECISGKPLQRIRPVTKHPRDPEALSLTYKRPTEINNFYVLRARVSSLDEENSVETSPSPRKDLTKMHGLLEQANLLSFARALEIDGDLETLDGKVCVKVKTSWNI